MKLGKIDWYKDAEYAGYGFIRPNDNSPDVFFHYSAFDIAVPTTHLDLNEGDPIEYQDTLGPKGPQATLVRRVK